MVLLIDEVDRVEVETEALLLEILSDYQVSIPELGTITATQIPLVFLTSNNTRELSEALKRRCLFLHVDYPDLEREKEIVLTKVPDISENLADQVARIVRTIRNLELKKAPSVSETLDWANTLMLLGVQNVTEAEAVDTLHILLKYQTDIAKAAKELGHLHLQVPEDVMTVRRHRSTVLRSLGEPILELRRDRSHGMVRTPLRTPPTHPPPVRHTRCHRPAPGRDTGTCSTCSTGSSSSCATPVFRCR